MQVNDERVKARNEDGVKKRISRANKLKAITTSQDFKVIEELVNLRMEHYRENLLCKVQSIDELNVLRGKLQGMEEVVRIIFGAINEGESAIKEIKNQGG